MAAAAAAQDDAHLLGEWARLLFGTLLAAGVSDVFISPGSRSTPFTWQALQMHGLRCHAIIDERCAAFAALGMVRAVGRPAALLCTSGSAPAHYFPALIEAALAFLPLLVITADRPFEVQHSGAAQTIDQLKLYGDHVRRFFELGLPDSSRSALLGLRRAVTQAVAISRGPIPGPVHINVRARKPLESVTAANEKQLALVARVDALLAIPPTYHAPALAVPCHDALREMVLGLVSARAGAIVIGPLAPQLKALLNPLCEIATALGYPILAEASSQLRFVLSLHPLAFPAFNWLVGSEPFRRKFPPDVLLCLGLTPTCSDIDKWALDSGAARYVICEHDSPDPNGTARMIAQGDLASSLNLMQRELASMAHQPRSDQRAFAAAILESGRICRTLVSEELACEPDLAEGAAVACIAQTLPSGAQWILGNSLPIRDVDAYVFEAADVAILSQRGANGIDGLVSGAAGSALGTQRRTLLLLGDVSLLHDLGGLAVASMVRSPLVIAVIDNDGGRIFDQLPVRNLYDADSGLAQFWRTPPGCDLRQAARLFGLRYIAPTTIAELAFAARDAFDTDAATLLHVRVGADSARLVRDRVQARLMTLYGEEAA
jgi:2-succinyl-5-enolpyruvyl-6-hydroxy-3-cyclohexene-1-carboxylate synthase